MSEHAELRTHVYQLLEKALDTRPALLAQAVAEAPDADGLLCSSNIIPSSHASP